MTPDQPISVWYESHTTDGGLWVGSTDRAEVVAASAGLDVTFRKVVTYRNVVIEAWDPTVIPPALPAELVDRLRAAGAAGGVDPATLDAEIARIVAVFQKPKGF